MKDPFENRVAVDFAGRYLCVTGTISKIPKQNNTPADVVAYVDSLLVDILVATVNAKYELGGFNGVARSYEKNVGGKTWRQNGKDNRISDKEQLPDNVRTSILATTEHLKPY